MRPKQPKPTDADLFRMRFDNLLDQRHELVRLAAWLRKLLCALIAVIFAIATPPRSRHHAAA